MMSKSVARLIKLLPEKLVVKIARNKIDGYLKKYARINISGYENEVCTGKTEIKNI